MLQVATKQSPPEKKKPDLRQILDTMTHSSGQHMVQIEVVLGKEFDSAHLAAHLGVAFAPDVPRCGFQGAYVG